MKQIAEVRLAEVKKDFPKAQLYGDKAMGGTTYLYLLKEEPAFYGLPENPTTSASLVVWKDWVQPYGIWLIPIALGASAVSFVTTRIINSMSKSKGGDIHG